jgi:ubiquinone/menaquinone biosynthesis C-methylase UbiE
MSELERSKKIRTDYNSMSATYSQRYEINPLNGVAEALRALIAETGARRVLEAGCGTGHWIETLAPQVDRIVGLDASSGMLCQAHIHSGPIALVCGSADFLPFAERSFDLIYVVNALHHFGDKQGFIEQARRLLRPGGTLTVIGMDVASAIGHYFVYDSFPGAAEYDLSRFPLWEQVMSWMHAAGLDVQPLRAVEDINDEKRGREILDTHFIQRYGTSTLMGLTDAQYQAGIECIKKAIAEAEARGEAASFKTDFQLMMAVGKVPV